jgi:hypothetical protein
MTTLRAYTYPENAEFSAASSTYYTLTENKADETLNFRIWHSNEGIFLRPNCFKRTVPVRHELDELFQECSIKNWDGYGAKSVDRSLRKITEQFIDLLPEGVTDPEVGVDPDGEISLDWYFSEKRMFSISIGKKGRLSYAGLSGKKKVDGVDYFDKGIPPSILFHLRNILK